MQVLKDDHNFINREYSTETFEDDKVYTGEELINGALYALAPLVDAAEGVFFVEAKASGITYRVLAASGDGLRTLTFLQATLETFIEHNKEKLDGLILDYIDALENGWDDLGCTRDEVERTRYSISAAARNVIVVDLLYRKGEVSTTETVHCPLNVVLSMDE